MCCITGATGSGKTYSALSFAERWDEDFNIDRVVFTPQEFIKLLNSGNLKKGSVIVADEFGVSMNSRNWQSASNQMLNYVMQTFRSKNYAVLFTSPDFGFIDASARKLFHCHMMTQGINKKAKEVNIKPYMLQINQRSGDVYYKFLQIDVKGQGIKKVNEVGVSLPTKKLIKAYELKKDKFVSELNAEIEAKLFAEDNKEAKQDKLNIAEQKQWNAIDKLRAKNTYWNEIAELFSFPSEDSANKWFKRHKPDIESS